MTTTIWWLRHDLRLHDNPALAWAAARGRVIPVYIMDKVDRALGGASKWWLHHSLAALGAEIPLVLRRGEAQETLTKIIADTGADAVVWNRCYEAAAIKRDSQIKAFLREAGLQAESFNGSLLIEPWQVRVRENEGYKVFTPFWKKALGVIDPQEAKIGKVDWQRADGETLADWGLLPAKPDWAGGLRQAWVPGEKAALRRVEDFIAAGLQGYAEGRDRPDLDHVSRLSAHLHFGEVSVGHVWRRVRQAVAQDPTLKTDADKFCAELGWREFCHHLLYDFPELPHTNWKPVFENYPWQQDEVLLKAWQKGRTGYPLVDAGMRQLWATGWIHNRVRMVAASFLIKHLRMDWRLGEAWFWDTLVDADTASNAGGWQWVAGSGADAAPYFRIFNPTEQARKFDPQGAYIKRWCPELAGLPEAHIHAPWEAPALVLKAAGIELGKDYPLPVIDHAKARAAALEGYQAIRKE